MTLNIPNMHVFRLIGTRGKAWFLYLWWQQCYTWSKDSWQFLITVQLVAHITVSATKKWLVLASQETSSACRLGSVPGMCPFSCHHPPCPDSLQSDYYITMNYTPWTVSSLWQSHNPLSVPAASFDLCSLDSILYHTYWIFNFSFSLHTAPDRQSSSCWLHPAS